MRSSDNVHTASKTPWLGWLLLVGLAAWAISDWLRTLAFAITSWGLWAGLVDAVVALRLGVTLILVPLGAYLLVKRQDPAFLSRARWLMWAGALLAGLSYLGLTGRIGWAVLALGFAFLGLLAPVIASLKTGCASRMASPFGLAGLVLLALLVDLAGFFLYGYAVVPYPGPYPKPAQAVAARRQQDVRYLGSELARLHTNAYHTTLQPVYWEELARLEAAAPALDEAELALEMLRVVAAVGDGHTSFKVQQPSPFHPLPVDLRWYGNDLHVRGIGEAYPQALGARVLKIGSLTAEQAYQAALPFIAHENDSWARVQSRQYLNLVELLVRIGAVDAVGPVSLALENADLQTFEVEILPLEPGEKVDLLSAGQERPYYLSQPELPFWYEYHPASGTLYFRYAACNDLLGFRKAAQAFWKLAEEQPVERLVIDLRGNGGGNTYQFDRFFLPRLKAHPELDDPQRLFVLIDRQTFSSASDHAANLSVNTRATLVGEPTGGKPNSYGEVRSFRLPNSKAQVYYSTNYFRTMEIDPPSIEPDVLIYAPAEAVFSGQDPLLEYVAPEEKW